MRFELPAKEATEWAEEAVRKASADGLDGEAEGICPEEEIFDVPAQVIG